MAAGCPPGTAGMTVNRYCSSGLQAIAIAAGRVINEGVPVIAAGGVESISLVQTKHKNTYRAVSETVTAIDPTATRAYDRCVVVSASISEPAVVEPGP